MCVTCWYVHQYGDVADLTIVRVVSSAVGMIGWYVRTVVNIDGLVVEYTGCCFLRCNVVVVDSTGRSVFCLFVCFCVFLFCFVYTFSVLLFNLLFCKCVKQQQQQQQQQQPQTNT